MKIQRLGFWVLLLAGGLGLAERGAAANITWDNSGGTARWNTSEDNWVGATNYVNGDNVTFGTTGAGSVYIGTAGPTPVNVAPGSVSITGGNYTFSGGDITSGSFSESGGQATFGNSQSFGGGTSLTGGTLVFDPASAGSYGFGSGAISQNGGSFTIGGPAAGTTTLTNNFTIGSSTSYILWAGSGTARVLSGNFTLNGNGLTFGNAHSYVPGRALQLTGTIDLNGADRTISSWNEPTRATVPQLIGNVTGGGTRSLSLGPTWTGRGILIGGNGGWNIKNLHVGIQEIWVSPTADNTDFFSGIRANGGKVTIAQPQTGPGLMYLQGGAYQLGDFAPANTARVNVDLASGRTVNILGGTVDASNNPNGLWLTPGTGTLAGDFTVGGNGVVRNIYYSTAGTVTTKYGDGNDNFRLRGGAVYEVATGAGDWNSQVRLALQAQNAGDSLRLGDGNAATVETVAFRGSCNVAYAPSGNPPPTRGFIMQFDSAQVVDDGNVVLRYETPTANPLIVANSLTSVGAYNSTDRLIIGWSDRTSSAIQYQFRGGSAGTEFVPRVAGIDVLGPTAGTVFTATSPTRLLSNGTVGFYKSDANMDRGSLGAVAINGGGSFLTTSNGTVKAASLAVNSGGLIGGIGTFDSPTTITASGRLAPGNSPGAVAFSQSLTLDNNAIYDWEFGSLTYDTVNVQSNLTLGASVTLRIQDAGGLSAPTDQYVLFSYNLANSGGPDPTAPAWNFVFMPGGRGFINTQDVTVAFNASANQFVLTGLTSLPEPSILLMLAGGGWLCFRLRQGHGGQGARAVRRGRN